MKRLLFVITLCLPAICFGQLNGSAVICVGDADGNATMETFQFGVNSVTQKFIFREGDSFTIRQLDAVRYSVTSSEVIWYDKRFFDINEELEYGDTTHTLSRKTGSLVETAKDFPSHLIRYGCQIFADVDSYNNELNRIRDSQQEEYDKEREGNVL